MILAKLLEGAGPEELSALTAPGGAAAVERLAFLRDMLAALEAGPLPEVPDGLLRSAERLFEEARLGPESRAEGERRKPTRSAGARSMGGLAGVLELVAAWIRTGAARPALGMRGATAMPHQLLRAASPDSGGEWEIELAWSETGALIGHVCAPPGEEARLSGAVCTMLADGGFDEVPVRQNGDFRFAADRGAPELLVVESDSLRLVIPVPGGRSAGA